MLTAHTAKRQLPISTKIRERKSGENLIDIFLCSTFRGEQHPRRLFILFCGMTSQTQFQTKLLTISNFFPFRWENMPGGGWEDLLRCLVLLPLKKQYVCTLSHHFKSNQNISCEIPRNMTLTIVLVLYIVYKIFLLVNFRPVFLLFGLFCHTHTLT